MKNFLKLTGASLKMTYRERMALFWMFFFPLLLMLLLGTIFGRSGDAQITLGLVFKDGSSMSEGITSGLEHRKEFKILKGSEKELIKKVSDGKANAVLIFDKGFLDNVRAGKQGKVTIYVDRSSMTTASITYSVATQVVAGITQGVSRAPERIKLEEKSVISSELRYVDFIVPGILAMTLLTSGVLGLALSFVYYREKGILRRIKVSPLPLSRFLGGELTADLLMALIQAAVLLAVGMLVFKVHVKGNWLYIVFLVILGAASFLALGFLIASVTRTLKTAQMAANAVTFPMMFLSGVFFPLSILPGFLVVIAKMLPLYYLGDALREVMIRGKGLGAVWLDIVVLAGMGLVCFLVSIKLFRWE